MAILTKKKSNRKKTIKNLRGGLFGLGKRQGTYKVSSLNKPNHPYENKWKVRGNVYNINKPKNPNYKKEINLEGFRANLKEKNPYLTERAKKNLSRETVSIKNPNININITKPNNLTQKAFHPLEVYSSVKKGPYSSKTSRTSRQKKTINVEYLTKKTAANAALEKKLVEMELQIKESKQARELANKQLIEEGLKKKYILIIIQNLDFLVTLLLIMN